MRNKGVEIYMPYGMIFRRMWCANCGAKLKRHKVSTTYRKDDEGYKSKMRAGGATFYNLETYTKIIYNYQCPECGKVTTYEEQVELAKIQKKLGKKVLKEIELEE